MCSVLNLTVTFWGNAVVSKANPVSTHSERHGRLFTTISVRLCMLSFRIPPEIEEPGRYAVNCHGVGRPTGSGPSIRHSVSKPRVILCQRLDDDVHPITLYASYVGFVGKFLQE